MDDANMITVTVKPFGDLRRCFADLKLGQACPVQLPPAATLAQLVEQLDLPGAKTFFVNGVSRQKDFLLHDQDEVAIMPLVGGG